MGTVALIYIGGVTYFHFHFYPHTRVGNIEIGLKTVKGAKSYVKEELDKYVLTVEEPDSEEKITAKDAGLSFSDLEDIDQIRKEQSAAAWPVRLTREYFYDALHIQVDEGTLSAYVDTMKCMNPVEPKQSVGASIKYDDKKKKYKIKEESIGNIVDKEHFLEGLTTSLTSHSRDISLKDETYYEQPEYKKDTEAVLKAKKKLNKYLNGAVVYKDGGQELKIARKDLSKMLTCSKDFKVDVDKEKVKAYVKDHVAATFNSLDGDIPSGITAWKVSVDDETSKLIKNIKSGKNTTRKPVYSQEGFDREEYNVGKTYIDVNISDQQMWYVENGKIMLSSDIVTGNISTGHATPTGFYRIAYRQRDHLMVKYNSFVHYWMPYITSVGIGFHDASWRSSFGGNIYRTNGSHGCINMPPAKAQALFGMISAGTAVYVHW